MTHIFEHIEFRASDTAEVVPEQLTDEQLERLMLWLAVCTPRELKKCMAGMKEKENAT